jgi:hypothetical protein
LAIREIIGCINASGLTINVTAIDTFASAGWRLGTDADIRRNRVNTPKDKKNAPAAESGIKRRKRTTDKLIRLDDLIPEKDPKGGRQLPFGVTDINTTRKNPK